MAQLKRSNEREVQPDAQYRVQPVVIDDETERKFYGFLRQGMGAIRAGTNTALEIGRMAFENATGKRQEATSIPKGFVFDPNAAPVPEGVLYEGFLCEGETALWIGREKHRKSTVILQFAISAAMGRKFLNFPAPSKPLRVVVLDYESKTASLQKRYDAICTSMELSTQERQELRGRLQIMELRKYVSAGKDLPKFPVTSAPNSTAQSKQAGDETFWKSVVEDYPADLYIIDPMRCLHAQDENDSHIEGLLSKIRQIFGKAAVVIAHHMTKRPLMKEAKALKEDMRIWSDGARGSGAIKAHADVIICQEQVKEERGEVVYWGAFLKDAIDIEPLPLVESDHESFHWEVCPDLTPELERGFQVLKGRTYRNRADAARAITTATSRRRSSAYNDVAALISRGKGESNRDGSVTFMAA